MPTPGVMKVRIGTDTQTNTPVKQVAFRFNGMSGPGLRSLDSDQMLRVGNVHKHLKVLPWPVQDDKRCDRISYRWGATTRGTGVVR